MSGGGKARGPSWTGVVASAPLFGVTTPAPLCGSEEQTKWAHLEFEDGQTVPIENSVSTSFYIGREPSANQHQHQFFHTADNVWRRVSAKHCHILRLDTGSFASCIFRLTRVLLSLMKYVN